MAQSVLREDRHLQGKLQEDANLAQLSGRRERERGVGVGGGVKQLLKLESSTNQGGQCHRVSLSSLKLCLLWFSPKHHPP